MIYVALYRLVVKADNDNSQVRYIELRFKSYQGNI